MLTVQHCCIASKFLYHCQSWCCMQTNYAASPQITLWASPESLLVFFNTNSKPRPLALSHSLSRSVCSWGGAGVCGHGGACGALGESWPARLGLWRKAWVDLQQQPGGRAYPAWPAGGLNIAHTQAHSPTVWKFRENRQRGWTRAVEVSRVEKRKTSERWDSQRHCMLWWRGH